MPCHRRGKALNTEVLRERRRSSRRHRCQGCIGSQDALVAFEVPAAVPEARGWVSHATGVHANHPSLQMNQESWGAGATPDASCR
jgi:hypothetical protein